jgi:DNA topoisomerase-1
MDAATAVGRRNDARKPGRNGRRNGRVRAPLIIGLAASARAAGLRYVSDATPGIRRKRAGRHFSYVAPDGAAVTDRDTVRRIKSLAIPPAWTDVWISPHANGHIQATGRDARGRKQYRYHPRWHDVRDETKYGRMVDFAEALPLLRERTDAHLAVAGLPREKVLATVVRLLEATLIRVGNEEYARNNNSFGLTTLRSEHVDIDGSHLRFEFCGKGGKAHSVGVRDRRLARIVKQCQELPGQELFQYVDEDGARQSIDSADVNAYLRETTGQDFTAKDFRTWIGTVLAAMALEETGPAASATEAKRNVIRAVERVAARLGNTVAVCRKCYVHPAVIDAYVDSGLPPIGDAVADGEPAGLATEEAAVLALLRRSGRNGASRAAS